MAVAIFRPYTVHISFRKRAALNNKNVEKQSNFELKIFNLTFLYNGKTNSVCKVLKQI